MIITTEDIEQRKLASLPATTMTAAIVGLAVTYLSYHIIGDVEHVCGLKAYVLKASKSPDMPNQLDEFILDLAFECQLPGFFITQENLRASHVIGDNKDASIDIYFCDPDHYEQIEAVIEQQQTEKPSLRLVPKPDK